MRRWTVTYGGDFLQKAARVFPADRSDSGPGMAFGEFMAGPVRSARLLFETQWDQQPMEAGGAVRVVHTYSRIIGPVVFYGVLIGPQAVEIASFDVHPGYWDLIAGDPDD